RFDFHPATSSSLSVLGQWPANDSIRRGSMRRVCRWLARSSIDLHEHSIANLPGFVWMRVHGLDYFPRNVFLGVFRTAAIYLALVGNGNVGRIQIADGRLVASEDAQGCPQKRAVQPGPDSDGQRTVELYEAYAGIRQHSGRILLVDEIGILHRSKASL